MKVELITKPKDIALLHCDNPKTNKFDGQWYMTLVEIRVSIDGTILTIPPGFVTDLGSVPKIVRNIVDAKDQSTLAFVIHDFIGKKGTLAVGRKTSDRILCSVARRSDQSKLEAVAAYWGTRIGGWMINYFKKTWPRYQSIPLHVKHNIMNGTSLTSEGFSQLMNTLDKQRSDET